MADKTKELTTTAEDDEAELLYIKMLEKVDEETYAAVAADALTRVILFLETAHEWNNHPGQHLAPSVVKGIFKWAVDMINGGIFLMPIYAPDQLVHPTEPAKTTSTPGEKTPNVANREERYISYAPAVGDKATHIVACCEDKEDCAAMMALAQSVHSDRNFVLSVVPYYKANTNELPLAEKAEPEPDSMEQFYYGV